MVIMDKRKHTARLTAIMIALTLALTLAHASSLAPWIGALLASDSGIMISVDGVIMESDTSPMIENSRVMIPLRSVIEYLGGKVLWYPEERQVIGFRGARGFDLIIGSSRACLSDGTVKTLDTPAYIVGGRAYVPLRFVSEAMGCEVWWEEATRTVRIATKPVNEKEEVEALARPALLEVSSDKGAASGFFFTKDGLAITCADIVDGAAWIMVKTSDGVSRQAVATVIDRRLGLAKIRVYTARDEEFAVFRYFDDFAGIQSGDSVFMFDALGTDGRIMTEGVITAKNPGGDRRGGAETYDVSPSPTASNRGGPAVKTNGAIIGINYTGDLDGWYDAYVIPIESVFKMSNR